MSSKKITYGIGFNVDTSGLQQVRTELKNIGEMTLKDLKLIDPTKTQADLDKIKESAKTVQKALEESFNPKLGTVNVNKFNDSIKESQSLSSGAALSFAQLGQNVSSIGTNGVIAFRNLTTEILTSKKATQETSRLLDSMKQTFLNTIKWSISSSVLNTFTGSIQKAWNYTQKLDTSLNDIRIVTEKSAEEMEKFAKSSNKIAKNLGAATTDYTKASLIYYQQGLGEEDVSARANVTVKAANVTGQSASEVSEQLTAVWNGYKVVAEDAERYVDKLAAVAASTAADLEELSEGMSKVASAANTMGVDIDQLSAQLSTIVSVTRQDASSVGTALKTIYARMGDLKVDGVDEFGTSLGDVSGQMRQMGIEVLDQEGNLRDMGEVIEEVAAKWGTWTDAQQQAAAVAMAGKRQYNNLIALFENWDMYESALTTSQNSEGTLQKQQDIYMDSLEAHLQKLSTSGEKVYDALFNSESMKDFLDLLSAVVDKFGTLVKAVGGGGNLLAGLGGGLLKWGSSDIAKSVGRSFSNYNLRKENAAQDQAKLLLANEFKGVNFEDEALKKVVDLKAKALKHSELMTEEEKEQVDLYIKQKIALENQLSIEKEKQKKAEEFVKSHLSGRYKVSTTGAEGFYDVEGKAGSSFARSKGGVVKEMTSEVMIKDVQNELESLQELERQFTENTKEELRARQQVYSLVNDPETGEKINVKNRARETGKLTEKGEKALKERAVKLESDSSKKGQKELSNINKALAAQEKLKVESEKSQKIIDTLLNKSGLLTEKQIKVLTDYQQSAERDGKDRIKLEKQVLEVLKDVQEQYQENIEQYEKGNKVVQNLTEQVENVDKGNEGLDKKLNAEVAAQEIANLAGNILMTVGAVNALSQAWKVWSDDTLTTEEKVEQFIMTLLSSLATLVPTVLTSIQAIVAANEAGGSAAQSAWGWIGAILTIITLIVTLVVNIVKAIPKQETALEKATRELEEAQNAAEKAKETFAELKEEYSELLDEMSKFHDARTAIDELRVGTEEWQKAVAELNDQVLSLLDKYPQLMDFITEDENGVLSIKQEGWDNLAKNLEQSIATQRHVVAMQNLDVAEKEKTKIDEEYKDTIIKNNLGRSYSSGYKIGIGAQHISDYYKSFEELGIGKVIETRDEEDLSGATKYTLEIDSQEWEKMSTEELINLRNKLEDNKDSLGSIGKELEEAITATLDNKNALEKNAEKTKELTDAYKKLIGDDKGVSGDVLSKITKDKAVDVQSSGFTWDRDGSLKIKLKNNNETDIEKTFHTNEEVKYGMDWTKEAISQIYGEDAVYHLNESFFANKDVADVMQQTIKINGEDIKFGDLEVLYKEARTKEKTEELIKEDIEYLQNLEKQGRLQETAFFKSGEYEGADKVEWDEATLNKINNIKNTSTEVDISKNINDYSKNFLQFAREQFAEAGLVRADVNKAGFQNFTAQDFIDLNIGIQKAGFVSSDAKAAIHGLVSANADSPEKMDAIKTALRTVNWSDASSVKEFLTTLSQADIDISNLGNTWTSFINSVASGNKQWIQDSKKVIDNLAKIKDIAGELSAGDIISTEEFKELVKISPEVEDMFVKTADGMMLKNSGQELREVLKSQYKSLADIEDEFAKIRIFGSTIYGDSQFNIKSFKTRGASGISSFFTDSAKELAEALGFSKDAINSALTTINTEGIDTDSAEYIAALDDLASSAEKINQAALDVANGEFDSQDAKEYFLTSVADTWADVVEANLDKDETAIAIWKNKYREELGYSEDWGENLGIDEIQKHLIEVRKTELDYFKKINSELDLLNIKIENAFGKEKLNLLKEQIKLNEDSYELAKEDEKRKEKNFEDAIKNSDYQDLYNKETGLFNLKDANDRLTKIENQDSDEYKMLDKIISYYGEWQDSITSAAEAAAAVADSQIELYNSNLDLIQSYYDLKKSIQEFNSEFVNRSSFLFGEQSIQERLSGIIAGININQEDFNKTFENYKDFFYINEDGSWVSRKDADNIYDEETESYRYRNADGTIDYASYKEDLNAAYESTQEKYQAIIESYQELSEEYSAIQKEIVGFYEKQVGRISHINTLLRGQADLSKLVGRDIGDYFEQISVRTVQNYDIAREKLGTLRTEYEKVLAGGASDEQIAQLEENMAAAAETVINAGQEAISAIVEQMSEEFKQAISDVFKDATGKSYSYLSTEWELAVQLDERYVDEVNKAYEISKLNRDIQKSIDSIDSITAQNKLNQLREKELAQLREKEKLTQYDLDHANAMYELTLKQIALEEAQQTANKMKLVRDASGNYSYQYVQDNDAIAQAEADLAEAENNLYNMNKDEAKTRITEIFSLMEEGYAKIAELREQGLDDEADLVYQQYFGEGGIIDSLTASFDAIEENMGRIGESFNKSFIGTSFETLANMDFSKFGDSLKTVYETTGADLTELKTGLTELLDGDSPIVGALNDLTDVLDEDLDSDTIENLQKYSTDVLGTLELADSTLKDLAAQLKVLNEEYLQYLENNAELGKNTEALGDLTTAISALSRLLDSDSSNDTDALGILTNLLNQYKTD